MSGETCPRCRYRKGYPIPQSILRANKMVFVCRSCGHRWIKRNAPVGTFGKWYIYGIGFLIGIGIGLYQLSEILFKDKMQGFFLRAKELFESLVNMLKGFI